MKQLNLARSVRLIAAFALTAMLAGCVTKTIATDPTKGPVAPGQSPVVVSITSNTGQIRGFDTIRLTRFSEPGNPIAALTIDKFELRRVAPGMARDTALFVGSLPAGNYMFSELVDVRSNQKLNVTGHRASSLGKITVTADAPVDLGRLIVTPLNSKVLYGRSALVQSNADLLKRFSPDYARLFAVPVRGGWSGARPADDHVEEYALARPVGADCMTEMDDGRVVAASRLGAVLVRDKHAQWSTLRGPGIESLLCVLPVTLPDADLLAVGEFGALLKHVPGTTALTPVDTGNLPPGNLLRIAGNAGAGWYVAHQDRDQITFFHATRLEGGDWKPIGRESVKAAFWGGERQMFIWTTRTGFAYSLYKGPMQRYDFASGTWSKHPLPDGRRLVDLQVSPNGLLSVETIKGRMNMFGNAYVSNDDGRTWTEAGSNLKVIRSPVLQLPDGTMLMYASVDTFGKVELQASRDGGKTWTPRPPHEYARMMAALKSGTVLLYDQGDSGVLTIRSSQDGGATWTQEYTTFDSNILELRMPR
ncbi:hypothetical protein IP92_01344 [Pseudoduganella flava]|uniref:Exo-alpha-sialidase n=1 Tax=Pseudoduganella flava TaxID=871742 RepID=A0A562Q0A2_9BURK|nr:sialidase family protein [Pseudoduganella flava]QGZ38345.1 hypothetical protein GO485_04275 [Pseudoduganella flava]TWI50115.1 hypothetical protein IP92_01344 [Pseudoduganella flava]